MCEAQREMFDIMHDEIEPNFYDEETDGIDEVFLAASIEKLKAAKKRYIHLQREVEAGR